MRYLSRGGNRLGRYGIGALAFKGSTPHPLRLDRDRQRKGSPLWPIESCTELVSASARSPPPIFTLAFVGETMTVPTAECAPAEKKH
jgi:hypothetical protein